MLEALTLIAAQVTVPPRPPDWGAELALLRTIATREGEAIWPGFGEAPFGLLVIERGGETLICHPTTPPGFPEPSRDAATGCNRWMRPRSALPDNLLAAMPIFGPPSTIVVGTPQATRLTVPRWRLTLLHEHFHQWQASLPAYYARVAALELAGGDETGMWMLNYPFPYDRPEVAAAYAETAAALVAALAARHTDGFAARLQDYTAARRAFAAAAGERHWRYLEFQLWQEGVARWTEIALGRASSDPAMQAEAEARTAEVMAELGRPDLTRRQRLVAYPMGAGEAMLLEACGPQWRARYPTLLALGPLVEQAAATCGAARG